MDFDLYFDGILSTMQMNTKKLHSLNNWYFQKTDNDVSTSARPYSVGRNELVPVIFQDKSADPESYIKQNKQNQSSNQSNHKNNQKDNQNETSNSQPGGQVTMSNENNEQDHQQIEETKVFEDGEVAKGSDVQHAAIERNPQNAQKTVHNRRFGLIAYNIPNIETEVTRLVISEPPGPDKLQGCEFDEDGARFVWNYANGIRKSDALPRVKEDVERWLKHDISPLVSANGKFKTQPVNQFIKSKYGEDHKNVYERVLCLNKKVNKTPLSAYDLGPYSRFQSSGENELINNLEVMPAFTRAPGVLR